MGGGKGKKLVAVASHEERGSSGEESVPTNKRSGMQQNPPNGDDPEKRNTESSDQTKSSMVTKDGNVPVGVTVGGKKRRRLSQTKEKGNPIKEEKGVAIRPGIHESTVCNGFRPNGSRRKSKPRRAAEAGVQCK